MLRAVIVVAAVISVAVAGGVVVPAERADVSVNFVADAGTAYLNDFDGGNG